MGPLRAFWKIATALGKLRDAIKLHQRIIELHQETLDQHQRAIDALLSTNANLSTSVNVLREMVKDLQRG